MSCLCEKCWNTRSTELRACWGIILFLTKFISNKVNSQLETAKTRFAAHTFAAQDYGELFMFFLTPPTFFLHSTLQCWLTQTRTGVDIFPQNWSKVDRKQGYFCSEHLLFSLNCLQNIPPLVGTVGTQSGNLNQCQVSPVIRAIWGRLRDTEIGIIDPSHLLGPEQDIETIERGGGGKINTVFSIRKWWFILFSLEELGGNWTLSRGFEQKLMISRGCNFS